MTVYNSQLLVAVSNVKLQIEVKYSGIIINSKFMFETQVNSVLKIMGFSVEAIQIIRNNLPKKRCQFEYRNNLTVVLFYFP